MDTKNCRRHRQFLADILATKKRFHTRKTRIP